MEWTLNPKREVWRLVAPIAFVVRLDQYISQVAVVGHHEGLAFGWY